MPPLRERRDDIPLLIEHFLAKHRDAARAGRWRGRRIEALITYDWPGNVRQLGACHRTRGRARAGAADRARGPAGGRYRRSYRAALRDDVDHDLTLRAWASRYVRLVLDRHDGNKRRACEALDITYHTLQTHLQYTPAVAAPERAGCRV